jgi:hypothetical protein
MKLIDKLSGYCLSCALLLMAAGALIETAVRLAFL